MKNQPIRSDVNPAVANLFLVLPGLDTQELTRVLRKPLLDSVDVAFIFQRSARTIRRWRLGGELPCQTIAGSRYFVWRDILEKLGVHQ